MEMEMSTPTPTPQAVSTVRDQEAGRTCHCSAIRVTENNRLFVYFCTPFTSVPSPYLMPLFLTLLSIHQ